MERNKIIILAVGSVLLIILTVIYFMMEQNEQIDNQITQDNEPASNEESLQDEESDSASEDISLPGSNNDIDMEGDEESEDEADLRENAQEAISRADLTEDANEMNENTLYEHALLYQYYNILADESVLDDENAEWDAEWISIELDTWLNYAFEHYNFEYSQDDFRSYVNEEETAEQDDRTRILLDELSDINETLALRQKEIHFMKQFIWENIREDVAADESVDLAEEGESNQLFYSLDQEVMEEMLENHPELIEDN